MTGHVNLGAMTPCRAALLTLLAPLLAWAAAVGALNDIPEETNAPTTITITAGITVGK